MTANAQLPAMLDAGWQHGVRYEVTDAGRDALAASLVTANARDGAALASRLGASAHDPFASVRADLDRIAAAVRAVKLQLDEIERALEASAA